MRCAFLIRFGRMAWLIDNPLCFPRHYPHRHPLDRPLCTVDMTIIAGSGLLSISIAFNSMSLHGTCTAVFVVVATIITFILASIQTLEKIAWITYAGFISLVVSRESFRGIELRVGLGLIYWMGVLSPRGDRRCRRGGPTG